MYSLYYILYNILYILHCIGARTNILVYLNIFADIHKNHDKYMIVNLNNALCRTSNIF